MKEINSRVIQLMRKARGLSEVVADLQERIEHELEILHEATRSIDEECLELIQQACGDDCDELWALEYNPQTCNWFDRETTDAPQQPNDQGPRHQR